MMRRWSIATGFGMVGLSTVALASQGDVREALGRIERAMGKAPVMVQVAGRSHPSLVRGRLSSPSGAPVLKIADDFLATNASLLAAPLHELAPLLVQESAHGAVLRFRQIHRGVPVFGAGAAITLDAYGVVRSLSSTALRVPAQDLRPSLSLERARSIAEAEPDVVSGALPALLPMRATAVRLGLMRGLGGQALLVYKVELPSVLALMSAPTIFIDAHTGRIVRRENRIKSANRGRVYAHNPALNQQTDIVQMTPITLPDAGLRPDAGTPPDAGAPVDAGVVADGGIADVDGGGAGADAGVTATDGGAAVQDGGAVIADGGAVISDGGAVIADGGGPTGPLASLRNDRLFATNCIDNHSLVPVSFNGRMVNVHVCDELPKAFADANGDFLNEPIFDGAGASEDAFAEQMMYHHANVVYEFFRTLGLDTLRTSNGRPSVLQVIANYRLPVDFATGRGFGDISNPNGPLYAFDNAAFMAAGESAGFTDRANDALVFGEGTGGDYAYDADVIYHEFTHAVISSTSNITFAMIDDYGLDSTPGGLNEGYPDYFSSALAGDPVVGEYAGRIAEGGTGPIRDIANTNACPANITGESHDDSLMWTGALWEARMAVPEARRFDFDVALYLAMAGLPEESNFEIAAEQTLGQLSTRLGATLEATVRAIFTRRGVLDCNRRVVNYTTPHDYALVEGSNSVDVTPYVPGYFQQKIAVPAGHDRVVVTFAAQSLGRSAPSLAVLGSPERPVQFIYGGNSIDNPGDFIEVDARLAGRNGDATLTVPGGQDAYIMIVNKGRSTVIVQNVKLVTKSSTDGGVVRDGGALPDAGPSVPDAGVVDAGVPADAGTNVAAASGGCVVGGGAEGALGLLGWLLALAPLGWRRRRVR